MTTTSETPTWKTTRPFSKGRARGLVADATLEERRDVDPGALIRRCQPEEERGANCHRQREEQHVGVKRRGQLLPDRQIGQEHVPSPAREHEA